MTVVGIALIALMGSSYDKARRAVRAALEPGNPTGRPWRSGARAIDRLILPLGE